jgi:hypothetical protein
VKVYYYYWEGQNKTTINLTEDSAFLLRTMKLQNMEYQLADVAVVLFISSVPIRSLSVLP